MRAAVPEINEISPPSITEIPQAAPAFDRASNSRAPGGPFLAGSVSPRITAGADQLQQQLLMPRMLVILQPAGSSRFCHLSSPLARSTLDKAPQTS
jgi:hypothetical protein